jgi:hypothetical protein
MPILPTLIITCASLAQQTERKVREIASELGKVELLTPSTGGYATLERTQREAAALLVATLMSATAKEVSTVAPPLLAAKRADGALYDHFDISDRLPAIVAPLTNVLSAATFHDAMTYLISHWDSVRQSTDAIKEECQSRHNKGPLVGNLSVDMTRAGDHYFSSIQFEVIEERRPNTASGFPHRPLTLFVIDARWGSHLGEAVDPQRTMTVSADTIASIADTFRETA